MILYFFFGAEVTVAIWVSAGDIDGIIDGIGEVTAVTGVDFATTGITGAGVATTAVATGIETDTELAEMPEATAPADD